MTKDSKNKPKVPNLRFEGFKGEWKRVRLGNISNFISKGTTPKTFTDKGVRYIKIESLNGISINKNKCLFISNETHYGELKRSILEDKDILFAIAGATIGKIGLVVKDLLPANTNQALAIIRLTNKEIINFIVFILDSNVMKRYIQESISVGAQPNLNLQQINNFKFYSPQSSEQLKIASFLTTIDNRIKTQNEIIEDYKLLKKGTMQRLFKQEIRFKDENGNPYPEWEKKKLKEILNYEQPTKYLVSDTEYNESHNTPVLTAGKTFLLGYTNEQEGIFKDKLPTIIFDDFTTAFQFVDFPFKAKSSAMKMLIPTDDGINLKFVFEAMKIIKFPLAEHKRYWISEYQNEKIPYPCTEEQHKIAATLSAIDNKIELETQLLEQLNEQKRYFLQNLFT